jgi:hypothetical protein
VAAATEATIALGAFVWLPDSCLRLIEPSAITAPKQRVPSMRKARLEEKRKGSGNSFPDLTLLNLPRAAVPCQGVSKRFA